MKQELKVKTKPSLDQLMQRLIEAEETIEAIKYNKIDALLISTKHGEQVWTLGDTEQPYRILIEQINEGAVTISTDGRIIFSNSRFAELLNVPFEHIIGSSIFKWIAISYLNNFTDFLKENKENTKIELNLLRGDITLLPASILLTRLNIDDGGPVICLTVTDLTERRKFEEISAAEKLARSVIEQASEAIIVCDEKFKIIRASRSAEKMAGQPLLNLPFNSIYIFKNSSGEHVLLDDLIKRDLPATEEVLFKRKNGEVFNLIFKVGALSGVEQKILGYIITLTNITSYVEAEEKISASLKEKTLLLKEVHHRVKNNLQLVSSLLNIQASYIKDSEIKEIFKQCRQRISSMALIHRKLYETRSYTSVYIDDYIEDLVAILCNANNFNTNKVELKFPSERININADSAVPLGLIMNELLTNSFKHAFSGMPEDKLVISIEKNNNEYFAVSVKDNGKGFPGEINFRETETLGLQLVNTLIEQLNGRIELICRDGTEFRMTFPLE